MAAWQRSRSACSPVPRCSFRLVTCAPALGVDDALGNTLAVLACQPFGQLPVLHEDRAAIAGCHAVPVVGNARAGSRCQAQILVVVSGHDRWARPRGSDLSPDDTRKVRDPAVRDVARAGRKKVSQRSRRRRVANHAAKTPILRFDLGAASAGHQAGQQALMAASMAITSLSSSEFVKLFLRMIMRP